MPGASSFLWHDTLFCMAPVLVGHEPFESEGQLVRHWGQQERLGLGLADDQELELICPAGHRFVRKTGHLRGSPQFRCPQCGAHVDAMGAFPDPRLSVGDAEGEELRRRLRGSNRTS